MADHPVDTYRRPPLSYPLGRPEEVLCKDVRSTTLERLRKTREADLRVRSLLQPLQLGEGLYHLLDRIELPVESVDLTSLDVRRLGESYRLAAQPHLRRAPVCGTGGTPSGRV